MAYVALYFLIGFFLALRLAYLAGQHYSMHSQNGDPLYCDKQGLYCKSFYCDLMPMGIAYLFMTTIYPVFLIILLIGKILLTIEKAGFKSVLPPENSHPGKTVE
jgi:hypothetical protein